MSRRSFSRLFLLLPLCLAAFSPARAVQLTWTNITGSGLWNYTDANWVGSSNFVDGYDVFFRPSHDARAVKSIYLGSAPSTPLDLAPGNVRFSVSTSPGGNWFVSGGAITGGASVTIGWDATVVFTNYTADILTFTNGTVIESGWLNFHPTAPGVYSFGRGPIIASQRATYVGFRFLPTVPGCTLVNDFIVPAAGANWYGTINGGKILGTIRMDGSLQLVNMTGAVASNRIDSAITLTGDRTFIAQSGTRFYSPVDGQGTNALTIDIAGNFDAWTDWSMGVQDDTNTPVWTIGGLGKRNTGNLVFYHYRNLGEYLSLRTGALILGGLGAVTNHIRDTAAVNLEGGKLVLRRDTTSSQTETVGSVNLRWGYNEIRLSPPSGGILTLAATSALTRSFYSTALFAAPDLGGSGGGSGSGRITFPTAPPLLGGGGPAGGTKVSIVPYLLGGLNTDNATVLQGDAGSTFVTYDTLTQSLRNLNTATEFMTAVAASVSDDNVRLTGHETLAANASINSLILAPTINNLLLTGPHILTVNSGAILSRGANPSTVTVDVSVIDFAGVEGVVHVVDQSPNQYGAARLQINSEIRNGGLTKGGYGRLDLMGNSTFTGPLVMNSGAGGHLNNNGLFLYGTLATTNIQLYGGGFWLQGDNRLPAAAVPVVDSRATFYGNGKVQTLANFRNGPSGAGTVNLGATGRLTMIPAPGDTNAFLGAITTGTLIMGGTNPLVLAGSFAPATNILEAGSILRRTATSASSPAKTIFRGGVLELAFSTRDWTYNNQYVFEAGGGGWSARDVNANPITIWAGGTAQEWGVSPGFVLNDDPLMFNSPYANAGVRYDSPINLGSTAGTPRLREIRVADNPGSTGDYAYIQGIISGTAADKVLWKTGDGILQLQNGCTFAGGSRISGGTLRIPSDTGLGAAPAAAVTNVTFDGGGLQFTAAFAVHVNRAMLIQSGRTATFDTLANAVTVAGRILGGGEGASLVKKGTGRLILSGTNAYVGANMIMEGTLAAGQALALGSVSNPVAMGATGLLDMNGTNLAIGALNGAAGAVITNGAAGALTNTLTVAFDSGTALFAGAVRNGATRKTALVKQGGGTLILSGPGSFTGPASVDGGALLLDGAKTGTGAVSVLSGALLGGTGTVAGVVTVASNATLTAADAGTVGTLTLSGSLVLEEGARLRIDVLNGDYDRILVAGTVTLPTNLTVQVNYMGGGWPVESPFAFLSAGAWSGATNNVRDWPVIGPGRVRLEDGDLLFTRSPLGAVMMMR